MTIEEKVEEIDKIFEENKNNITPNNFKELFGHIIFNKRGNINGNIFKYDLIKNSLICIFIKKQTSFLNIYNDMTFAFRLKTYLNKHKSLELCVCGEIKNFVRNENRFNKYCSNSCNKQKKEIFNKRKEFYRKHYNVDNYSQTDEYKDKIKKTYQEKYGVDHCFQSEEIKEKIKQTLNDRYNVDNYSQTNMYKEKVKETCQEKYGVDHYSKTTEYKKRSKETCNRKYNVDYTFQSKEIKEKIKQTCQEKYGVDNAVHSEEIKEKIKKQNLKYNLKNTYTNIILKFNYCKPLFSLDEFEFSNYNKEYKWECKNCKESYFSYYYATYVKVCPICTKSRSLGEIELFNYIKKLIPNIYVKPTDRDLIAPLELDIYIPELKLAFEYNGDYWHSLKEDGYHENKTQLCLEKSVKLFHIWESDWQNNKKETKQFIKEEIEKALQ